MKAALSAILVIFVVVVASAFGWYHHETSDVKARLAQFEAEAAARKMVPVTFSVSVPAETPKDQILYLSGSVPALGNWDAAGIPLQLGADGKHRATVQLMNGIQYEYKVTRGTWSTVETDAQGKDITNHAFTAAENQTIDLPIAGWIDNGKAVPGRVTMTGDIRLLKKFHSDLLPLDRTIIVYLPPGYEKSTDRYPVLYMQDGQNLFDEFTSYQGVEWRMDEAAQKLIAANKIQPIIIVGIYNTEQRPSEFAPPGMDDGKTPAHGDNLARFEVEQLKPFIDSHYRTMTDRAHTGIGGGSQGALISLFIAKTYPDVFGQFLLMSPWLHLNGKPLDLGNGKWLGSAKLYVEMGNDPGHNYSAGADCMADGQAFAKLLAGAGLRPDVDFTYREIEGGRQNESGWSNTIESALVALYGKPQPASTNPAP